MAQKKKTAVKAKAAKAVAPPKKSTQAVSAARKAAAPVKPAASVKDVKKASAPAAKAAATVKPAAPAVKPVAAKPAAVKSAAAKAAPAAAAKAAVSAPAKPAAASAAAKKPVTPVPAQAPVAPAAVRMQPSKAAAAFAAHRAQAAQPAAKPAAPARAVPAALAKAAAGARITAPAQAATVPASPKAIAEKAAAARQIMAAQKKPVNQRHGFKTNEFIVYPAHGVGRITGIEEQEIAGMSLELFVINFEKEKLTLRVPTGKLESVGMRKLADDDIVKKAMEILKGRARIKRTMWSRRAQEYVAKINSGDLISIAEVVRDLYRSEAQPEQSYSERQLYEDALDRMAREIAAVEKLDDRGAVQRITDVLSKSARGRRLAEEGESEEVQAA